jgi:hypothetical protein
MIFQQARVEGAWKNPIQPGILLEYSQGRKVGLFRRLFRGAQSLWKRPSAQGSPTFSLAQNEASLADRITKSDSRHRTGNFMFHALNGIFSPSRHLLLLMLSSTCFLCRNSSLLSGKKNYAADIGISDAFVQLIPLFTRLALLLCVSGVIATIPLGCMAHLEFAQTNRPHTSNLRISKGWALQHGQGWELEPSIPHMALA